MASKKQDKTKKTEGKAYFVVHLLDGTTKDFDKKCTSVNYSQGPMIAFLHAIDAENNIILSIIPAAQIREIEKVDE